MQRVQSPAPQTQAELQAVVEAGEVGALVTISTLAEGMFALEVSTEQCSAQVALQGAQIMRWAPQGMQPVLFVSPKCVFASGKALRGGIPVCFPWFAQRTDDTAAPTFNMPHARKSPNHGLVRTSTWQLNDVQLEENGRITVALQCEDTDDTRALWDHGFSAVLTLSLGSTLSVQLAIRNTGESAFTFEEALHSYFAVGEINRVAVTGIQPGPWIDKPAGPTPRMHDGSALRFAQEVDAVFLDTKDAVTIVDESMRRCVDIAKSGSKNTVVWNPHLVVAQALPDVGGEAWRNFVCVETANVRPHDVYLPPGATHTMAQRVSCRLL